MSDAEKKDEPRIGYQVTFVGGVTRTFYPLSVGALPNGNVCYTLEGSEVVLFPGNILFIERFKAGPAPKPTQKKANDVILGTE
jgi:hypothetical protein